MRSEPRSIRFSEAELLTLQTIADNRGLSMSAYIRQLIYESPGFRSTLTQIRIKLKGEDDQANLPDSQTRQ